MPNLIAILVTVAALAVSVQQIRLERAHGQAADCRAHAADVTRRYAEALAHAEQAARAQEQRSAEQIAQIAQTYEQEKADAQTVAARTIDDLRAGTLRLRSQWKGCEARHRADELPGTAASIASDDDAAELRRSGAADIVRLAAECDAQVSALQAQVRADRGGLDSLYSGY